MVWAGRRRCIHRRPLARLCWPWKEQEARRERPSSRFSARTRRSKASRSFTPTRLCRKSQWPIRGRCEAGAATTTYRLSIKQVLRWENSGTVSLSDARLIPWNIQRPMMEILAGGALIHDNFFQPYRQEHTEDYRSHDSVRPKRSGTAVRIGPGVDIVMVHNNQLNGNRIVNESGWGVSLANNQP